MKSRALRFVLSVLVGFGAFVGTALVVTIVDLYLSGHGMQQLSSAWIDWKSSGVRMSRADVLCLSAFVLMAAISWRLTRPSVRS